MTEVNNMELWDSVCESDPKYVKKVTLGGRKFSSPQAQYQIMTATQKWGPFGMDWGVKDENYAEACNGYILIYTAILFYPIDGAIPIHSDHPLKYTSGKRDGQLAEDATKKLATDALTKGLSKLGFNADIFLGRWDDNKYVMEMEEKHTSPPPPKTPAQLLGEAKGLFFNKLKFNLDKIQRPMPKDADMPVYVAHVCSSMSITGDMDTVKYWQDATNALDAAPFNTIHLAWMNTQEG